MRPFELIRFQSDIELANTVAAQCVAVSIKKGANAPFCLALSGGRIAQHFFSALANQAKHQGPDLGFAHFFWADERCVPPTDPQSNFGLAHHLLFAPLAIPSERIHRIQGELSPEKAASLASEELAKIAP